MTDPLKAAVVSMGAGVQAKTSDSLPPPPEGWPRPIGDAAYHGVVGEFVAAIEPHTEGDASAILVQTLVALGNVAGREPHFTVEDSRHGANLFAVVVGDSSKARKGTSYGRVEALAARADAAWAERNAGEGGLSTPEGLLSAVRDPREVNGKHDPGVADKRLLAALSEFAELLSRMRKDNNPLSQMLRAAWDGSTLRTRTVGNPMTATGAHISVVAHITEIELKEVLTKSDISNGFGNRFLWVLARRSKLLPLGGHMSIDDLAPITKRVTDALAWAGASDRAIEFTASARKMWTGVYAELGQANEGKSGPITDRSEAQVRRIALVYAILDKSTSVKPVHLEAALEVWRYCEDSARYIFGGERSDDRLETRIERHLRKGSWTSQAKLNRLFKGKVKSWLLKRAIEELIESGAVESRKVRGTGRPRTEYRIKESG